MEYSEHTGAFDSPISLRPMGVGEFALWRERFVRDWSDDLTRVEDLAPDEAQREAARRLQGDLPDGMATLGHHLFVLLEGDAIVGDFWFSISAGEAFLEDITIVPDARGRGVGKAALALVEIDLRRRGQRHLDLHVYADNTPAIALYRGNGYRTTGLKMRKVF